MLRSLPSGGVVRLQGGTSASVRLSAHMVALRARGACEGAVSRGARHDAGVPGRGNRPIHLHHGCTRLSGVLLPARRTRIIPSDSVPRMPFRAWCRPGWALPGMYGSPLKLHARYLRVGGVRRGRRIGRVTSGSSAGFAHQGRTGDLAGHRIRTRFLGGPHRDLAHHLHRAADRRRSGQGLAPASVWASASDSRTGDAQRGGGRISDSGAGCAHRGHSTGHNAG